MTITAVMICFTDLCYSGWCIVICNVKLCVEHRGFFFFFHFVTLFILSLAADACSDYYWVHVLYEVWSEDHREGSWALHADRWAQSGYRLLSVQSICFLLTITLHSVQDGVYDTNYDVKYILDYLTLTLIFHTLSCGLFKQCLFQFFVSI